MTARGTSTGTLLRLFNALYASPYLGSTRALDKKLRFKRDPPIEVLGLHLYGALFSFNFTWRLRFIRIPYSPFTSKHRVTWTTPEFEFVSLPFQWSFCCFLRVRMFMRSVNMTNLAANRMQHNVFLVSPF
jgi:hypothetical protein